MTSWSHDSSEVPREVRVRDQLNRAFDANGSTPSTFLDLLDTVTAENLYESMPDKDGKPFGKSFIKFITTDRPHGLGLRDKNDLKNHIKLEHREERAPYRTAATCNRMKAMRKRIQTLLDGEIPQEHSNGGDRRSNEFQCGTTTLKRNTRDHTLSRLKRDDPSIAEKVTNGEITANAAAKQKGWRKPRIIVSTPARTAAALRKHMSPEDLTELVALLATTAEEEDHPCTP